MNTKTPETLAGLSILVLEDEAVVAMMLEDTLLGFGCKVELASGVEQALSLIRTRGYDGVLLDMNVHGRKTVAVAEELAARSAPFLLVTGYGPADGDPPVVKSAPRVQKPFDEMTLARRMAEVFGAGRMRRTVS